LSKNNLGHDGAIAVGELLEIDNELLYLDISGESFSLHCSSSLGVNVAFSDALNFGLLYVFMVVGIGCITGLTHPFVRLSVDGRIHVGRRHSDIFGYFSCLPHLVAFRE